MDAERETQTQPTNPGSLPNATIAILDTTFIAFSGGLRSRLGQFETTMADLAGRVDRVQGTAGNQVATLENRFQADMAGLQSEIDDVKVQISAVSTFISAVSSEFQTELVALSELIPPPPTLEQVTRHMSVVIAKTNLAIRWVAQSAVKEAAAALFPGIPLPSPREVRQTLINLAEEHRATFSCSTGEGKFGILMRDGAHMSGRNWVGVCIATYRQVSFWRVKVVPRQTAMRSRCL
jgi:hypothetical protein